MASSVPTLIADARTFAQSFVAASTAASQQAIAAASNIGFTLLSFDGVTLPTAPTVPEELTMPDLQDIVVEEVSEPDGSLVFQDISAIETGVQPTLTATAPTITLPTAPSALAEFQAQLPAIDTSIQFPDAPQELDNPLPAMPVLVDRDDPQKPNVTIPSFDAVAPTDLPDAPTDLQATFETVYRNAAPQAMAMIDGAVEAWLDRYSPNWFEQQSALEDKLSTMIQGGTGLAPAVETAIYERSRSKQDAEGRRVRDAAWADTANRGFTLPTGALMAAARRTRQAAADNNAQAAREIAIAQAELEQKNIQFALNLMSSVKQQLLALSVNQCQNLISINSQALAYAKSVMDTIVETYNVAVRAVTVRLEAFRAEAAVYETKVRAAMGLIELYRAEIQALEALTNVDRAKVDIYRARIDGLTALTRVYAAKIEAVQGEANLERLKIDLFRAQVDAHGNLVQAKASEWAGFTAAVNGQRAKAEVFESQVRALGAQTQAYAAGISAKAEAVRAQAITNQARSENFKAKWAAYQSLVAARGEVARTKLESQRQQLMSFQVQSQAQVANAQMRSDYYKSVSLVGIENAKLSIDTIVKSAELQREHGRTLAMLADSNAKVIGQAAAAAMAGMNTLAGETLAL